MIAIKSARHLVLNFRLELDRLRSDGHKIVHDGRHYVVHVTPEAARHTLLYRTVLHEIGHWVDWKEKVQIPADHGGDWLALSDAYFARPACEREAFAHRYANTTATQLTAAGKIPFSAKRNGDRP